MLPIEEKARRIQALSVSERLAEEQRQTAELVALLEAEIVRHGQETETPMLNAVFVALAHVEVRLLATLAPEVRRNVIKGLEKVRPGCLAAALTSNPPRVTTIRARRADA